MKIDLTSYQCDRCRHLVTIERDADPETTWWDCTINPFGRSAVRRERKVILCTLCANELDKWLRDREMSVCPRSSVQTTGPLQ